MNMEPYIIVSMTTASFVFSSLQMYCKCRCVKTVVLKLIFVIYNETFTVNLVQHNEYIIDQKTSQTCYVYQYIKKLDIIHTFAISFKSLRERFDILKRTLFFFSCRGRYIWWMWSSLCWFLYTLYIWSSVF